MTDFLFKHTGTDNAKIIVQAHTFTEACNLVTLITRDPAKWVLQESKAKKN